jgi:hypothetical protein
VRSLSILVLALLALSAVPTSAALPTPGVFCDVSDLTLSRLFPEAEQSNDYVSYEEAICGLETLVANHPDMIKRDVVAQSVGWPNVAGGHDQFEVFVVRVSNYASELPSEDKLRILFQLSIHGNEKGGREGGLRIIEDLVRDLGHAQKYPELRDYLNYMELLFVFPNPDGWTHEEVSYRHADACYLSATGIATGDCQAGETGAETQSFVRVNGHGVDVNREWPTVGWSHEPYTAMSEPEAIGLIAYLQNETNLAYASDIHGMLNPADGTTPVLACTPGNVPPDVGGFDPICMANAVAGAQGHFVLTMLPAGRQDPYEMAQSTALAELVKERLNSDPYFATWTSIPSVQGAWGGEYNDWGTVWDTIGYTDSGFTSDFYAQDTGLNTPGIDFELAYNHITVDNYYPGLGALFNAYHVETVREIVRAFMDQAALDIQLSVDAKGTRTAVLDNPTVVTNAGNLGVSGWAAENPADDAFDTAHVVYEAAPADYWKDLKRYMRSGDAPAILDIVQPAALSALANYDNLVIAGSASERILGDPAAISALRAWVEAGGNLVLTDGALRLLEPLGLAAEGSVDVYMGYAGATNFVDREHDLAQGIRGLARETYEPVPLGFGIDAFNAPNWFVAAGGFEGEVVGVAGEGQGSRPNPEMVNFGRAKLGAGTVSFLGSLLPDPSNEGYTPYGVDSYATTYTGNQLLRNMLGWDIVFAAPPKALEQLGTARALQGAAANDAAAPTASIPGAPLALVLVGLAGLALARRR